MERSKMKFKIVDPGQSAGSTDGAIGVVGPDNAYIKTYAVYPDMKRPTDLDVGEKIANVKYSLSGSIGFYDIVRVE